MTDLVRVVHLPSPFACERRAVEISAGPSLEEIAAATKSPAEQLQVVLDGKIVPADRWAATTPAPGSFVVVSRRPQGVEALVAVSFLSAQVAQVAGGAIGAYATYLGVAAAGASFWAGLARLTSAFIEVPGTDNGGGSGARTTVTGDRNRLPRYEPGIQVLGRHKFVPPTAAATITVLENGKLVQYSLYTFGKGPLELSELKIGEDPLFKDSTTVVYEGQMEADAIVSKTTVELRQGTPTDDPITLYPGDIQEAVFGERLRESRAIEHRTVSGTVRIVVLIGFPNGLVWLKESGGERERTVRIRVEHRAAGSTGTWTDDGILKVTEKTRDSVYVKKVVEVDEGTYDVRVERITEEGEDQLIIDESYWTSLHQHRAGSVVLEPNLCLVAMRRQLTNNAAGLTEDLSGVAQTVALDWDSGTQTWVERATSNNASLFRHVLQGEANLRAVADARIDLTTLEEWHEECDDEGFEFNWVTSGRATAWQTCRKIAAAGRASAAVQDGLFTVIRDTPLTGSPVGFFTPRNVISFTGRRVFDEQPHGWKVPWVNPAEDWLPTEDIVYDDGYSASNATTFERFELAGLTDWDQSYKLGRYHLAQVRLRPEEFVIDTPIGSLNNVRGDWVKFAHDACLIGLAYGRVVSVAVDGSGNATGVTVDQQCPMGADTYGIRFWRAADGGTVYETVVTAAGLQTVLAFTSSIPAADKPAAGDLFSFGEDEGEMIDCRVKAIEPGDDHTARLVLVDAAAAALDAADGTIPAYESHVSIPPATAPSKKLPKPRVIAVESASFRSQEQRTAASAGIRIRLGLQALEVRK